MVTRTCLNYLTNAQPTDLVNQSIPFSYLTVEVAANDGNSHSVQLYTDVTGEWLVSGSLQPETDQLFQWGTTIGDTISYQFSLQNQTQFLEVNGRARYGSIIHSTNKVPSLLLPTCVCVFISTSQVNGMTYEVGQDTLLRPGFITTGALNNTVDSQFREISNMWPVFAFAHDLGVVTTTKTTPIVYTIGHVRDPLVQLLNIPNINSLRGAYYLTRYSNVTDMVHPLYTPSASDTHLNFPRSRRSSTTTLILWRAQ